MEIRRPIMSETEVKAAAGQITAEAAEIYEKQFVPALFGQFAQPLVNFTAVSRGDRLLDVASGTGVVARAALAAGAFVTAVDINEGMNAVARRLAPGARFESAAAEALPFAENEFDAVICQFGLMFFDDRAKALAEMARVTRSGGRVSVAVFDNWEKSPGYCDLIPLINEVIGFEAAEALKAPFCLGDPEFLQELLEAGGLRNARIIEYEGTVRQPSLDHWLDTEIGGWTLATMVDAGQLNALKTAARDRLAGYVAEQGTVVFPAPARFAIAQL
jgi:SAM-dependent methyltransferase